MTSGIAAASSSLKEAAAVSAARVPRGGYASKRYEIAEIYSERLAS